MSIEHKSYEHMGFLGNLSNVYFRCTISFFLANFWASVALCPSDDLIIQPHPKHDLVSFHSMHHLVQRLNTEAYYGGVRLLMAIYKVFYKHCQDNNIKLKKGNFTLSYDTNIPSQVAKFLHQDQFWDHLPMSGCV